MAKSSKIGKSVVKKTKEVQAESNGRKKHLFLLFVLTSLFGMFFVLRNQTVKSLYEYAYYFSFPSKTHVAAMSQRTNVLILGKGDESHEAPDLTDTIMFASINYTEDRLDLISLPRDIWDEELRAKINSAYYWGKKNGDMTSGAGLAKKTVEKIVGKPIHYVVIVDFDSFTKTIDYLGGVDVEIENSFVDNKYPIKGKENDLCGGDLKYLCRYETISFEKGILHMSGEEALKYVRSRNAEGDEGTDFARAKRQQQVVRAIVRNVLSEKSIKDPNRILGLIDIVQSSMETEMTKREFAVIGRGFFEARDNVSTHVLPDEFLINPPISRQYDNLYVFIPRIEGWTEVHDWVSCVTEGVRCKDN